MEKIIVVCAWCGRMRVNGIWTWVAIRSPDQVSHGICGDCFQNFNLEEEGVDLPDASGGYRTVPFTD